jgi:predicted exporter
MAENFEGVYFVNKAKDIGTELDRLTGTMLLLFLGAYILIAILVWILYPKTKAARICIIPIFLVLAAVTVLSCLDIALSFFPVVGLVLVFGLGLDYVFYITEDETREGKPQTEGSIPSSPAAVPGALTMAAIFLSFATTALSFGALALSSFVPVHIFGIAVFSGLSAAFIAVVLIRR